MANTGSAIGGLIGLGVGLVIADRILDDRHHSHSKKKKRKYNNWVERETNL